MDWVCARGKRTHAKKEKKDIIMGKVIGIDLGTTIK